jgi:1-deoxy-D-xylulose-5-phosphate synthase
MAIDVTQGTLATLLDRIRLTRTYTDLKHHTEQVLRSVPLGEEISVALRHIKDGLRTTVHGEQFFEGLGFRYFGPVDGHDIGALQKILRLLAHVDEPVLLHVHTQKGRGCDYAVEDPCRFHSPSAHTVNGGVVEFPEPARPRWTEVFSQALMDRARRDERIVAITAAMPDGTGLVGFRDELPDRYIDVGINESLAVAMAAGMAKAGLKPVVAIYSTFCQRAFDQVFEEVSLQNLPVILCMDRAGLVGSDGAVHHGWLDLAYLRPLPGMVLMSPADAAELNGTLDLALSLERPCAIRYPRDEAPEALAGPAAPFELGKAHLLRRGADGTFLALGAMAEHALAAAGTLRVDKGIETAVYSARFVKPLDEPLIARLIESGRPVLTVEDHAAAGGFGSAVMELAAAGGLDARNVRVLGLPDRFILHAGRAEQLAEAGLDAPALAAAMATAVAAGHSSAVTGHS